MYVDLVDIIQIDAFNDINRAADINKMIIEGNREMNQNHIKWV